MNKYEDFEALYKPRKNPLNLGAPCGTMFETYGSELTYVNQFLSEYVWTVIDNDNGMFIVPGYHYVDRFGYFVCELPWHDPNQQFTYMTEDELDA